MKTSKFSDAHKAFILKQGDDGMQVDEICRKAGISQATYFNWRKKYAGLLPDEMRRSKALEDENYIDPTGLQGPDVRHVDSRYKSRRTGLAPLERRIKEICETRVGYGYRRVHVYLCCDVWEINMRKTRIVYNGSGLPLHKRPERW